MPCHLNSLETREHGSPKGQPVVETLESRTLYAATLPTPDHVVIVMEENHTFNQILGSTSQGMGGSSMFGFGAVPTVLQNDSYIRSLAKHGANLTNFHAETNPSQPNYIALFSGATQGVTNDAKPDAPITAPSLGGELIAKGLTFTGYSEDLPAVGFTGSTSGDYARKHAPWVSFADVPAEANQPLTSFPKKDFTQLPTVSFVIPNQQNDMHSGSIRQADRWLKQHLKRYVKWAKKNNSLLVVTWDEGSDSDNHIPTVITGANVKKGAFSESANHYDLLRTIEDMYGLTPLGRERNCNAADGGVHDECNRSTGTLTFLSSFYEPRA